MVTSREVLDGLTAIKRSGAPLQALDPERLAHGRGGRKKDVVSALARAVGREPPSMSTGSTEPREIFLYVDDGLGLRLREGGARTKADYARGIVDAAALELWVPSYESAGGTVTLAGLKAVLRAVVFLLRT